MVIFGSPNTAVEAYAVEDLQAVMAEEIAARGAARSGLIWHFARPPVEGLASEMDVRGVPVEPVLNRGAASGPRAS